ncbi:hypothetical protein SprV_0301111000 [Sparganum proliferum]
MIQQAWGNGAVPDDWGPGIFVQVFKKEDSTNGENVRDISLIDAAEIFAVALIRRFQRAHDHRTGQTMPKSELGVDAQTG